MVVSYHLKPAAQDTGYLRRVWETVNPASCPHTYNFHLHTVASDGRLEPIDLINQAIAIGLKGLAITDHHSVAGFQEAQAYLSSLRSAQDNAADNLPQLWTGTEITSNLAEVEVHILGYGFDPSHPAINSYLQGDRPQGDRALAGQVITSIHQAGGLAVLAHPERYRRSATDLIPLAAELNIDGVETYYAYNNPKIWQPSPVKTETVQALAAKHHLYSTCGTDTHGTNILQRL
ncbi:MAG: PHP domain-containing protein [Cyanobacteria bacterium J06648_1]